MGDYDYLGRLPPASVPDPSTSAIGAIPDSASPAQDNGPGWYNGTASGLMSGLNDTNNPVGILTTRQAVLPDGTMGTFFVDPNVSDYQSGQSNGAINGPNGLPTTSPVLAAMQKNGPNASLGAVADPNAANSSVANTNYGSCPPNVGNFVAAHQQDAQTLADGLGNEVTPAEVLAVSGNETRYGDNTTLAKYGNYFGLHGTGPAGTYLTRDNETPTQKFPPDHSFLSSGRVFVDKVSPYMSPGIGEAPLSFFTVLNQHGYATGHPEYPANMVSTEAGNRGAYTLVQACMKGKR